MISIDARSLRNILSLYNSSHSPIWAYQRTAEERYLFLFDPDGWILFQSEPVDKPAIELTTHLARSGYTGTLGRQGLESAFRPDSIHKTFWDMVADVREARQEVVSLAAYQPDAYGRSYFLAYAPVRFKGSADAPAQVVAGIAYLDISRLTLVAGYKHADIMFYITVATALVVGALIYVLGRIITRPILKLADAVNEMPQHGGLAPIELPYLGREITTLQRAINGLIAALQRQMEEIRQKDRTIRSATLKEQALLAPADTSKGSGAADPVPSIVGHGPRVERLKSEILKAAQVDADVLIIGETGTGKQLAAEAIHRLSSRSGAPFISINCGALDENLLLDTLFGHVKGAFTEARSRPQGGLSRSRPRHPVPGRDPGRLPPRAAGHAARHLGPPDQAPGQRPRDTGRRAADRGHEPRSAGADPKRGLPGGPLLPAEGDHAAHDPPAGAEGEHRRARPAFSEGPGGPHRPGRHGAEQGGALEAGALRLVRQRARAPELPDARGRHDRAPRHPGRGHPDRGGGLGTRPGTPGCSRCPAAAPALSRRQQKAYAAILARGRITRGDYQQIIGGDLPVRTAIYDLQDLVRKGVLKKTGSGPATAYVVDPRFTG